MTEATQVHVGKRPGCTRRRLLTVVGTVFAALAVFSVETLVLDLDLASPAIGGRASMEITFNDVLNAAGGAALLAWFGIAALEGMNVPKPRGVWTVIAVLVFLGTLALPFLGTGIDTNTRLALAALHVVVGAILIPLIPDWPPRRERVTAS